MPTWEDRMKQRRSMGYSGNSSGKSSGKTSGKTSTGSKKHSAAYYSDDPWERRRAQRAEMDAGSEEAIAERAARVERAQSARDTATGTQKTSTASSKTDATDGQQRSRWAEDLTRNVLQNTPFSSVENARKAAQSARDAADAYEKQAEEAGWKNAQYNRFGQNITQNADYREARSKADEARANSRKYSAYADQLEQQLAEEKQAQQIAEDPAAWMRWAQMEADAYEKKLQDDQYSGPTDGIGGGGAQTAYEQASYDKYQPKIDEALRLYDQAYIALVEQEAAAYTGDLSVPEETSDLYRHVNDESRWYSLDGDQQEGGEFEYGEHTMAGSLAKAIRRYEADSFMTAAQRQTFNYLASTKGMQAAEQYYNALEPQLEATRTATTQEVSSEDTREHPYLMTALSVPMTLAKIPAGIVSVGSTLLGKELDTNSMLYQPVQAVSAIRQTAPQATNWFGDRQLFGQDADEFVYGVITSSLDSAMNMALGSGIAGAAGLSAEAATTLTANMTSALMGAEMLPDTIIQEKAKGRSDAEATAIGVIRSLIEGVTEKYSIEYFLGDPTTLARKLGKAFLAEGGEEVSSNWLNRVLDVVTDDPDNVIAQWQELVDSGEDGALAFAEVVEGMLSEDAGSFLAGGISGLGMAGVSEGTQSAVTNAEYTKLAELYQGSEQETVDEALATAPDSKAVQRAKEKLDAGKTLSTRQLGRVLRASDAVILEQEEKLTEASRKYGKQAAAMRATYDGEQDAEQYDEAYHVAYEMGKAGTNLRAAMDSSATQYLSREQRQAAWEAGRDSKGGSAADIANKRALRNRQIADVQRITVRDGKLYAEIKQGETVETVPMDELKVDGGTQVLAENAKQYGTAATTIFEQYEKQQQLSSYLHAANLVVSTGMATSAGSSEAVLENLKSGQLGSVLSAGQIETLYGAGQEADRVRVRQTGMTRLGTGTFTVEDSAKGAHLDKRQRAAMRFLRDLSRITGLDISVYKSEAGADGKLKGENGSYVNGRLRLDLNAGAIVEGELEYASMLRTCSHELTHFLAVAAKTEFKELQSFLISHLAEWKGHSIQDLVEDKIAIAEKNGRFLDPQAALEEVVADGCEMMLRNSKAIRQLAEENRTLFEKVRDWMTRFFKSLREAFEGVEAVHAESIYMMENYAEELQALWDKALTAAVHNAKTGNAVRESETSTDVQFSERSVNGQQIVWIENSDLSASQLKDPRAIAHYIAEHIGEVYRIIESGQRVFLGEKLPTEYTHSRYTSYLQKNKASLLRAKNKAAAGLGEMIEIATNRRWEKTKHTASKDAKFGMYRYDTRFAFPVLDQRGNTVNVRAYDAELLIRNASDGRKYLYDVVNIKENTANALDLRRKEARKGGYEAATQGSVSDNTVSQDVGESQEKRSERDGALGSVESDFKAASDVGMEVDAKSESVAPAILYSERTWTESDYVQERNKAAKEIAEAIGVSVKKAKDYIDSINSIAKMIAEDRTRLDYFSSPGRSSFVGNVEYGGSFDFSTLCKKRRLLTGTFSAIQRALPNTALTANEILDIRNRMKEKGLEVSCGLCYVEGSRANMGQFAREFLNLYKKYYPNAWQPDMADVNTPDGIEWVRINHPECYEQYEYFWNHYGTLRAEDKTLFASQQKPKLYQLHTEYKGEILQKFKSDGNVEAKNRNGGIRMQSFSDFEIVHLIDTMQIIMDMSRVGLAGQAYTKVPDFAWALGDTGLKINLSLIAKGVDENGRLIFDDVEGMPIKDAMALRDRYSANVGTILVVFNDQQLLAAMADDRVDFIIPFHRSQWKKSQYAAMGLPAKTKDYTYQQNEKYIKPQYHEYRGRMVKDKANNYMPNEYWDFNKSGKENAIAYLQMCAENNKRPKFYKLLQDNRDGSYSLKADGSTDGYWKLLIDFKMYDNSGKGSPQMPVQPRFNMGEATRMLNDYKGGHSSFPVAQGIVDDFVREYKENHEGEMFSERGGESVVKRSERDQRGLSDKQKDAVKHFGTTTDFNEAGYILPDGSMLRFTDDANAGARTYDHRAIGTVYGVDVDLTKNHGFNMESNRYMTSFVENGGIRFDPGDPEYDMDAGMQLSRSKPLTRAQEQTIRDFIAWKQARDEAYTPDSEFDLYRGSLPLHIEFGGGADVSVGARARDLDAWKIDHLSYEGGQINADRVIADIRHYYETGETRKASEVARFRYSDRDQGRDVAPAYEEWDVQSALYDAMDHADAGDDNMIRVGEMPRFVTRLTEIEGDFYLYRNHAYENMSTVEDAKKAGRFNKDAHYHGLGVDRMTDAIMSLEHPIMTIATKTKEGNPAVIMLLPVKGNNGAPLYGVLSFYSNKPINGDMSRRPHVVLTIAERDFTESGGRVGIEDVVRNGIVDGRVLSYDKKMRDDLSLTADTAGIGSITETSLKKNVARFRKEIKGFKEKNKINYQERDTVSTEIATLQRDIRQMQAELRKLKGTDAQDLARVAQYDAKEALKAARQDTKTARAEGVLTGKMEQGKAMAKQMSRMEAQKDAQIARLEKRIADTQKRLNDRIDEQRQRLETYRADRKESAARQHQREQVEKQLDAIYKMLTTNNDKLHVPEGLKQPLKEMLEAVMPSRFSKSMQERGVQTQSDAKLIRALEKIRSVAAKQEESGYGYLDLPPGLLDDLDDMFSFVSDSGTEPLYAMNSEQLRDLKHVLKAITTSIRQMNMLLSAGHYQSVLEASEATIGELDSMRERKLHFGLDSTAGKAEDVLRNFLSWKNTTPYYAFKRFGEGGQDMFRRLADGWDTLAFNSREIMQFAGETYTEKEVKAWEKEKHTVRLDSGETVTLTAAQAMELYKLAQRQQAEGHLYGGGIRISGQSARPVLLTPNDVETIRDVLSDRQREVADRLQEYMELQGSEWGNEVTMKRFGYRYFTEHGYYPIVSDRNELTARDTEAEENSMFRLLNLSMTKGLQEGANNAIVIGSIFDTFASHMSDMAKYNALALPILDMMKWYNYRITDRNISGQLTSQNVKQSIEAVYGSDALKYFTTFVKDLNGASEGGRGEGFANMMISNYKVAAVAANLRVALLQPTSYVRAANVISPKYLAAAIKNAPKALWTASSKVFRGSENGLTGEMLENSGIALWKSLGFYDTNIGRSVRDQIKNAAGIREKVVEKSMSFAELGDTATWTVIWSACKLEQRDKGYSGEELLEKTAERFRDVIYATQVVDSTMTRSHMMRSKSTFSKISTAFMSEPTLSYNMLLDAAMGIQTENRKGGNGWKTQRGKLFRAFSAFAATAAASALVESLFDVYRDDDDEDGMTKFVQALFGEKFLDGNLGQNVLPLGSLPYLKDVVSILQGYSNERMDTAFISKIANAVQIWQESIQLANGTLDSPTKITSYGSMTEWGKLYKTLDALSSTVGLPVAATTREVTSIWNATVGAISPRMKIKRYESEDQKLEWLYEFAQSGSTVKYNTELEGLRKQLGIGGKKTGEEITESIQSGMRGKIQDHFLDGDISAEEAEKLITQYGGRDAEDAESSVAAWRCEKETGIRYTDLKDAFLAGEINAEQAVSYRTEYGLQDAEKAEDTVLQWRYEKETGAVDASASKAGAYYDYIEPAGIDAEVFEEAWAYKQNATGKQDSDGTTISGSKKEQVVDYIRSLGLSRTQARAMWNALKGNWKDTDTPWE